MARPRRIFCRSCERHLDDCGPLSSTGRCRDCWVAAETENMDQLHAHSGPRFDHWRRRTLAAFGIVIPDREEVIDDA